jgi:hypothetical protein
MILYLSFRKHSFERTQQLSIKFDILFAIKAVEVIEVWFGSVQYIRITKFTRRLDLVYIFCQTAHCIQYVGKERKMHESL